MILIFFFRSVEFPEVQLLINDDDKQIGHNSNLILLRNVFCFFLGFLQLQFGFIPEKFSVKNYSSDSAIRIVLNGKPPKLGDCFINLGSNILCTESNFSIRIGCL